MAGGAASSHLARLPEALWISQPSRPARLSYEVGVSRRLQARLHRARTIARGRPLPRPMPPLPAVATASSSGGSAELFETDGDEQPCNGADEPFVSFWPADHFEAAHVHQGPKTGDEIQVALQFCQLCFVHPFLPVRDRNYVPSGSRSPHGIPALAGFNGQRPRR